MGKFSLPKIDLNRKPANREKLFFAIVLFVVFVLFINWLFTPQSAQLRKLNGNLGAMELQVGTAKKLIDMTKSQVRKLRDEPREKSKRDNYVKRILDRPVKDVTYEVNSTTDLLASRKLARRIRIVHLRVKDEVSEKNYSIVPITIEFTGRYTAVRDYLKALENFERPLVVKSVEITKASPGSSLLSVDANTELYIPKRGK